MGVKVEQFGGRGVHPTELKKGVLCEILDGGDTFTDGEIGELVYTTDDKDYLYVPHYCTTEEILGDQKIRVRPLPNGTRLVVVDNEGGQP